MESQRVCSDPDRMLMFLVNGRKLRPRRAQAVGLTHPSPETPRRAPGVRVQRSLAMVAAPHREGHYGHGPAVSSKSGGMDRGLTSPVLYIKERNTQLVLKNNAISTVLKMYKFCDIKMF